MAPCYQMLYLRRSSFSFVISFVVNSLADLFINPSRLLLPSQSRVELRRPQHMQVRYYRFEKDSRVDRRRCTTDRAQSNSSTRDLISQQVSARLSRYSNHSKTLQSISSDLSGKYDIKSAILPMSRDLISNKLQPGSKMQQPLEATPVPQSRSHADATLSSKRNLISSKLQPSFRYNGPSKTFRPISPDPNTNSTQLIKFADYAVCLPALKSKSKSGN